MINNMVPSVVRQIPSLPKTYFVRDIISYGYFGDVTRSRGTPFDEESEQGREYDAAIKKKTLTILHYTMKILPGLDERDRARLYDEIVEFFNDVYFNAPIEKQNRLVSSQNEREPVYFYSNDFRSRDIFGNTFLNRSTASHGSDLLYLFGPEMYQKFFGTNFPNFK